MDSEHRHELKSNELANFLTHFPDFLKKNANIIIGVALIAIALITWPMFNRMSRQKTIAEASQVSESIQMLSQDIMKALQAYKESPEQLNPALNTILVNADKLLASASETDNPNLEALAYVKAAQAIRTELHLKNEVVSAETVDTQIQKAQEAYEKASAVAAIPTMKAMAQFGLGLCAEERGQAQQAADIYTAITNDETFAATVFPQKAQLRLDALDDNVESFTFVKAAPKTIEVPIPVTPANAAPQPVPAESQITVEAVETTAQPAPVETPTPTPEAPAAETDSEE